MVGPPTPEQVEAVKVFLTGRDVFVSLPTGSGKSICFSCLPLLYDRLKAVVGIPIRHHAIVLVVCPLISLMIDQVHKMNAEGLKAAYVAGHQPDKVKRAIQKGDCQLVYISPESMVSVEIWRDMIRSKVYTSNLVCLTVDEAHLIVNGMT